eukprot:TRINITY_DN10102_c0_g1_i1.p1 TRINITY_DN10102_c0_g1~~TRINITY_DN10102_c0_g1_i1.p1  ORF type:complete len:402 (+),score=92.12 TRINITY_DN10102_c0_g1_i1:168-1373(+)
MGSAYSQHSPHTTSSFPLVFSTHQSFACGTFAVLYGEEGRTNTELRSFLEARCRGGVHELPGCNRRWFHWDRRHATVFVEKQHAAAAEQLAALLGRLQERTWTVECQEADGVELFFSADPRAPFPHDITREFLSNCCHLEAEEVCVERLGGGLSSAPVYSINGRWVAKYAPRNGILTTCYRNESFVYTECAAALGPLIPSCHYAHDPMLVFDLVPRARTLEKFAVAEGDLFVIVTHLARFHAATLAAVPPPLPPAFDELLKLSEEANERYGAAVLYPPPGDPPSMVHGMLHGDMQLANLVWQAPREVVFIDFQMCRRGCVLYELAAIIHNCMAQVDAQVERRAVECYMKEFAPGADFGCFWALYEQWGKPTMRHMFVLWLTKFGGEQAVKERLRVEQSIFS